MIKKTVLLAALIGLSACTPAIRPNQPLTAFSRTRTVSTALECLPLALNTINAADPQAVLYEIDVWHEAEGSSLQYGFLRADQSGAALRVIIDLPTQQVRTEETFKGPAVPIDRAYWQRDSSEAYSIASENGLKDSTWLATLWEDTWHISGLRQDLYFQIDSRTGAIKLRCTGPYNDNCTLGDGTPVQRKQDPGLIRHRSLRQSRR